MYNASLTDHYIMAVVKKYKKVVKNKGLMKKKNTFFKNGLNPKAVLSHTNDSIDDHVTDVNRPCHRHEKEYFDVLTKETYSNQFSVPGADGMEGSAMVLRPKAPPTFDNASSSSTDPRGRYNVNVGNILVEKSSIMELFNTTVQSHAAIGLCNNLHTDLIDFEPWGLFSSVIMICTSCGYSSPRTKLYQEISSSRPGRKAAAGNTRLQLLLQDMPIGQTELQLIFAAVGLRAGSLSGMQKASYKAAQATEDLAEADMSKWREFTKRVLADRGVIDSNQFSAEFDVRYHGVFRSSAKTPGPGAVQATATCVETVTSKKKCIAIDHVNKMCPKGSRLKGKGKNIFCGHEEGSRHDGCTATQPAGQNIRERDMAERIANDLLTNNDISITHLCTDCDADGKSSFEKVNLRSKKSLPELTWYKDLTHTSRNMKRKILNHKFAPGTFKKKPDGHSWNSKEILDCRKALALDVPERVAITLRNVCEHYAGDRMKIYNRVERIACYMVLCYSGNHKSCNSAPLARLTGCSGNKGEGCWFTRSSNFMAQGITGLSLHKADADLIKEVIAMKLSKKNIVHYDRRETTSRCESLNRAISKSCPKNKLFSKTSRARVCSAIGRQNNSFQDFTYMKCRAMKCILPQNSAGDRVIQKYQRKRDLDAKYQKAKRTIQRRRELRAAARREYFQERLKTTNEGEYLKNQLENAQNSKNSALDAAIASENIQNESDPRPSTSFECSLQNASKANIRLQAVLRESRKHDIHRIRQSLRSNRLRKKSIQARNVATEKARNSGSSAEIKLRMEHSYGSLL